MILIILILIKFHHIAQWKAIEKYGAKSIIIAGGVGSFEPRKFSIKEAEKFENNGVLYSIKDKTLFLVKNELSILLIIFGINIVR